MDQVLEKPAEHLTYTKSENRNESPKEKKNFFFFFANKVLLYKFSYLFLWYKI